MIAKVNSNSKLILTDKNIDIDNLYKLQAENRYLLILMITTIYSLTVG